MIHANGNCISRLCASAAAFKPPGGDGGPKLGVVGMSEQGSVKAFWCREGTHPSEGHQHDGGPACIQSDRVRGRFERLLTPWQSSQEGALSAQPSPCWRSVEAASAEESAGSTSLASRSSAPDEPSRAEGLAQCSLDFSQVCRVHRRVHASLRGGCDRLQ